METYPMVPLELRVRAFVDITSRLMNLSPGYKQEYEMHFRTHLQIIENEGNGYSDVLPELVRAYKRTIEDARSQRREELYADLEAHAAVLATLFAAREHALKNPILRRAFVKTIARR